MIERHAFVARFRPLYRERVVRRLRDAARYRVALIVAPAGFGKTTALRQYASSRPHTVIVAVPSGARTVVAFVRALADALAGVVPVMRTAFALAADAARRSATPGADLGAWAAFHLRGRKLTVAFDDVHVGDGDPEVAAFLAALVESAGAGTRFILSSRMLGGIPYATWLAYGLTDVPVGVDDLRLTLDEARACARAELHDVEGALAEVDGWPAGFQLALRSSLHGHGRDATLETIYQYLTEQVWRRLPARLADFVRAVAFLPRIDARLCIAAGFDDAVALIDALREHIAFVLKLGDDAYALHDLFRDFVRRDVRRSGQRSVERAWAAASDACIACGRFDDALEALIASEDAQRIVGFLDDHGMSLAERGQLDLVERALAVPLARGERLTPAVVALQGICAEGHGREAEAERCFRSALAALDGLDVARAVTIAAKIGVHHANHDRANALDAIEALLRRADVDIAQRAALLDIKAVTLAFTEHRADATAILREALVLVDDPSVGDETRAKVHANAVVVFNTVGDEAAMRAYAARAIEEAQRLNKDRWVAAIWMNLYLMHARAGRAVEAARCAAAAEEAASRAGDFEFHGTALRAALKIAAERGDDAEIERLRAALAGVPTRSGIVYEAFGSAMVFAAAGQLDDARAVLREASELDFVISQNVTRYALLALVAAAAGVRDEATDAIGRYQAAHAAADHGRLYERADAIAERWIVLATLLLDGPRAAHAVRSPSPLQQDLTGLSTCVDAALAGDRARFASGLDALRRADRAGIARFVEAACAPYWANAAILAPDAVPTKTERQILRCLADGLSNQAIAERQQRSVHTVRTQVAALLRKLGASSRGEATAIARRLGLTEEAT